MRKYFDGERRGSVLAVGVDQSYTGFAVTGLYQDGFETKVVSIGKTGPFGTYLALSGAVSQVNGAIFDFGKTVPWGMEGPAHAVRNGAHASGALGGAVILALGEHRVTPLVVPPTSVKKYATGNGNAKKNEILLAVYKKWGAEFNDDNAADSYVIARMAAGLADHQYERDVLDKLKAK